MTDGATIKDPFHESKGRALFILCLTLLWHLIFFILPWDQWGFAPRKIISPPPISVQQFENSRLEKLKADWKQRSLLLNKNLPPSNVKEAPKDARYDSDRNFKTEKEQRAERSQVMPQAQPGSFTGGSKARPQSVPDIRNLGVPLQLNQGTGPRLAQGQKQKQPKTMADQNSQNPSQNNETFGGDQSINDPNLSIGNMNILNTAESIYYTYFSRLYQAIGPLWQSDIRQAIYGFQGAGKEYTTDVFVIFDREGNLKRFEYVSASGVPLFDQVMEKAWKRIGRFPNPPSALIKEGEVRTRWRFALDLNGYQAEKK